MHLEEHYSLDTSGNDLDEMREGGAKILGWCNYRNKPITYYVGECSAFLPKRKDIDKCMSLEDFMG